MVILTLRIENKEELTHFPLPLLTLETDFGFIRHRTRAMRTLGRLGGLRRPRCCLAEFNIAFGIESMAKNVSKRQDLRVL